MKKKNLPPLLLASRDSLLALAQTIEAAIRLEKVGFTPKIAALKTAGDLKLDSPLYRVADQGTKEGRAFFTRELDDALITGRADAAVHSFKDLPAEKIDGISNPILFSETSTADILLSTDPLSLAEGGKNYTIGTSSLRRIHQLGFAWPYAKTVTLRGNIVTRLRKLIEKHDSINAILIAEAGFKRMKEFMGIPVEKYAHFLDEATLEHLTIELEHFKTYLSQKLYTHALPESKFPTAPGQGVLAFQFSEKERHKFTEHLDEIFPEHPRTAARALLERSVMTGLETGCHAPLGVSAHYTNGDTFHVSLCFSKSTTTSPVGFANSVFIERTTLSADALVDEVRRPFETIYWWGLNDVTQHQPRFQFVRAIEQRYLTVDTNEIQNAASLFVASPSILPFLEKNPTLLTKKFFAAGEDTLKALRTRFPKIAATDTGRGFASAFQEMPVPAVWLGSLRGKARAEKIANARAGFTFLSIYENLTIPPDKIINAITTLKTPLHQNVLHALTSAAAATSFVQFYNDATKEEKTKFRISTFGLSATEILVDKGFNPYHLSDAPHFKSYIDELLGKTTLMQI